MGPIAGSEFTPEQLTKLISNDALISHITDVLSWKDLGGFTGSGKDIKTPMTSKAILGSTTGKYLGDRKSVV